MSLLDGGGLPPIDPALQPASIRNGSAEAKRAYQVGLGFEQILVSQLTQQMADTVSGASDPTGSGDGGDSSSAATTGLMGPDPASSAYAQMIPTALSNSIMGSGGLGIALGLAQAIDPAIGAKR